MNDRPAVLVMDLGGVTCRWLPDRRLAELARMSGLAPEAVDQLVFESGFDDAGERGRFELQAFVDQLAGLLGLTPDQATAAALERAWATAFEPDRAVIDLIGAVDVPTALFTNNGPLLEVALVDELPSVAAAFDQLVFSWRLEATKPDPAAFERATQALAVAPPQIFFVDDSEGNVEAAAAAGWQAHHFTTALDLQVALRAVDLLR